LCNGDTFFIISSRNRANENIPIVVCKNCSLVQVNPRQDEQYYENYYRKEYQQIQNADKENLLKKSLTHALRRASFLEEEIDLSNKTILDVGCSCGEFLKLVSSYAKRAVGIEPDKTFAEYGRNHYELDIFSGSLKKYINTCGTERFDIVTLFTVIEHVHSPLSFLRHARKVLKENGLLILEFPEIFGLLKSIKDKRKLSSMFSRHHLQYFSKNTINRILKLAGFDLIKVIRPKSKYLLAIAHSKDIKNECDKSRDSLLLLLSMVLSWKIKDAVLAI